MTKIPTFSSVGLSWPLLRLALCCFLFLISLHIPALACADSNDEAPVKPDSWYSSPHFFLGMPLSQELIDQKAGSLALGMGFVIAFGVTSRTQVTAGLDYIRFPVESHGNGKSYGARMM